MKKSLIIALILALMLTACGQPQTSSSNIESSQISSSSEVESSSSEISSSEASPSENTEELTQLTTEQKIEDFNQYYNIMTKYYPALKVEKEDFGLDFEAKKDFYLEKIKETENDFEFYTIMNSIQSGFLGYHEYTFWPAYSFQVGNSEFVGATPNLHDNRAKMMRSIEKYGKETYEEYKGRMGRFWYNSNDQYICLEKNSKFEGYILLEINGKPNSEFVGNNFFMSKLKFDENKKFYRAGIVFNDKDGEPVKLKLKTPEGEIIEKDMFANVFAECAANIFEDIEFINYNENCKIEPIMIYIDKKNDYSYISIETFGEEGQWKDTLRERAAKVTAEVDNIIVDLRGNGGGYFENALNITYPLFHDKDAKFEFEYTLDNAAKEFLRIHSATTDTKGASYERTVEVKGDKTYIKNTLTPHGNENSPKNKNIYYLMNSGCGSATEQYLAMIKANKLATLIGTKSSGDGFITSVEGFALNNSGMVFGHTPYDSFNADGTSNVIYGTTPDIYCCQTAEDFQKEIELAQNGENLYTFENMLQWDTVLKRAVEEITK